MLDQEIPGATPLDGPIPGQSLTEEPGKNAWETPPEYTNVGQALEYVLQNITRDDNLNQLLVMLDSKMPVEAIVRVILFSGFGQGKWTYDMMILMAKPLTQTIIAIAKASDIDYELVMAYHKKKNNWAEIVSKIVPMKASLEDNPSVMPMSEPPRAGLMSRPGVE